MQNSFQMFKNGEQMSKRYSLLSLRLEGEETLKYRCVRQPRAEKFNIVRKDHGRTHKCDFSVSHQKFPFRGNLVQNIKIVSLS